MQSIIRSVHSGNLTYLDTTALADLGDVIRSIERQNLDGILIEAGCALGGSGIVIAAAKDQERAFFVFDVFETIPSPTEHDGADVLERYKVIKSGRSQGIKGDLYYGYQQGLYEKVQKNFKEFGLDPSENNIHFVRGLYEHSLVIDSPVAFAHIDCDWYQSVMTCLQRIEPFLVKNGVFVIDDYYVWSGCRSAVDEFFSDKRDRYVFERKTRLHIRKVA